MGKLLRKCERCQTYTLSKTCSKCGSETVYPHPPKFSLEDKYATYRLIERYKNPKPAET
ncbi:MAG: RNA-protein complex protein Nop10 [Thaumarchaeota archaeon]|nr:RNA-protein complex protein Nop10 [Nitrososphaerota archaeon]